MSIVKGSELSQERSGTGQWRNNHFEKWWRRYDL